MAVTSELHATASPTPWPRRARLLAVAAILSLGLGWLVGTPQAARLAKAWFETYVAAQQVMLEARGHVNADGDAEYAIILARDVSVEQALSPLSALEGVRLARAGSYPGTVVVALTPGDEAALDALRASPLTRSVAPNRGLWICH